MVGLPPIASRHASAEAGVCNDISFVQDVEVIPPRLGRQGLVSLVRVYHEKVRLAVRQERL